VAALNQAHTMVYLSLHNKFCTGHVYKHDLSGPRMAAALLLNAANHSVDFLPGAANLRAGNAAGLTAVCALIRIAVHPIDLRLGAGWLANILTSEKSIINPSEFIAATNWEVVSRQKIKS
jgi:hypothetical protein